MRKGCFIVAIILLLVTGRIVLADRQLAKTEILQIFQTLTAQPRNTWITAGTIEATHLEYKESSGYITESTVIVKYDGDKFYWEINTNSLTKDIDSKKSSRADFDLNWNKRRVFAWDGERYTMYFRPGNHVIVRENPIDIPIVVNGSLTAGVVPWGYGIYSYAELSAADSSAEEVKVNNQKRVHLTLKKANTPEMVFVLDPAKDYAVLSYSLNNENLSIEKTYEDYQLVADRWVPSTITIDRYENEQISKLLSHDKWNIISISTIIPSANSFNIAYETKAWVEYYSSIIDKPLFYRYSDRVDIDSLLCDRLITAAVGDEQTQNCATVAMKYVSRRLGKNITDQKLAELVNEPNEGTSLYKLQQLAQESGFHSLAVKTDIETLKGLNGCKVILYLPRPKHYVVLEYIDDEYVWITDLDNNKFFYRTSIDQFGLDWDEGAALLISGEPLDSTGNFTELGNEQLRKIIGGAPLFSCTDLIQEYNIIFCSEIIGTLCGGTYRIYYNRYGCELDPEGGNCTGGKTVGSIESPCILDPVTLTQCKITGTWYSRYIRACQ